MQESQQGRSEVIGGLEVRLDGAYDTFVVTRGTAASSRGRARLDDLSQALERSGFDAVEEFEVVARPASRRLDRSATGDGAHMQEPARNVIIAPAESNSVSGDDVRLVLVEHEGCLQWAGAGPTAGTFSFGLEADENLHRGWRDVIPAVVRVFAIPAARLAREQLVKPLEDKFRPHRFRKFSSIAQLGLSDRRSTEQGEAETIDGPSLVFVHGLASTVEHAFDEFKDQELADLVSLYDGRVFAFDHPTLSVKPDKNAQWLVDHLADAAGGPLDIVAHSRGGIVARELAHQLEGRETPVRSIVFVATPNSGTPLVAEEHHRALADVLTNAIKWLPPGASDAAQLLLDCAKVLLGGVGRELLPGMAALDPDGEYLRELNARRMPSGCRYHAVAVDHEPLSTMNPAMRLAFRSTDKVFGGRMNDLVVPTRSTYLTNNQFTVDPKRRLVVDSSHALHHVQVFADPTVKRQIADWLEASVAGTTAEPLDDRQSDARADIEHQLATARQGREGHAPSLISKVASKVGDLVNSAVEVDEPSFRSEAVIFIPGVMGSMLADDEGLIWTSPTALIGGRFGDLAMRTDDNSNVVPAGLHSTYAPIVEQLTSDRDVYAFPFDWRLNIADSARALSEFVDRVRAERDGSVGGPIHLVAHSMGGLVARAFLALRQADAWRTLDGSEETRSRLVMLGTPNRGSLSMALGLLGEDTVLRFVAALDVPNQKRNLVEIVRSFPGVVELLPPQPEMGENSALHRYTSWPDADESFQAKLDGVDRLYSSLAQVVDDPARMVYVAGDGHKTPARVQIKEGRFEFGRHRNGDGRVTHELGCLDDVRTYFTTADHGGLVHDPDVLDALDDLLQEGVTEKLATERPAVRSADATDGDLEWVSAAEVEPHPIGYSTTRGSGGALGAVPPSIAASHALDGYLGSANHPAGRRSRLAVSVVHTSLEHARFPVMVGHYLGLPLGGTERFLDERIGGALSRHHAGGSYPDHIGESLVVLDTAQPQGGIAVGLGAFGELSRNGLKAAVKAGAHRYLLRILEGPEASQSEVGMSVVLMSTPGQYGLTVASAVAAIIEGASEAAIDVAAAASAGSGAPPVMLTDLEIVELWSSTAEEAVRAAQAFGSAGSASPGSRVELVLPEILKIGRGGRPGAAPAGESGEAWPRVLVKYAEPQRLVGHTTLPAFEFTQLGRRAQVAREHAPFVREKVESLLKSSIGGPADDETMSRLLYEMLVPRSLKDDLDDVDNVHLLVDEESAVIPWELILGRGLGGRAEPLARRTGMLRQLERSEQHRAPRRARPEGDWALVVGDPPSVNPQYPRLPGARREAIEVADVLRGAGYRVNELIFGDGDGDGVDAWRKVHEALTAHPYRIIHFACHGDVDRRDPARTGLVVGDYTDSGDPVFLTADDFSRLLGVVPDLAFINACHVGRIAEGLDLGGGPRASAGTSETNVLAANLALALMRSGVGAVVAAGWAINDVAAVEFATTLYEGLLDAGRGLGDAVTDARRSSGAASPSSSTWGAYQCYGDPAFSLRPLRSGVGPKPPVSTSSMITEIGVLEARGGQASEDEKLRAVVRDLHRLEEMYVPAFDAPEVHEAFGRAYGSVGRYVDAVVSYRTATKRAAGAGSVSLATFEQLANLEARLAVNLARGTASTSRDAWTPADLFASSGEMLGHVIGLEATSERLAISASRHKKMAAAAAHADANAQSTSSAVNIRELVERARDLYAQAEGARIARPGAKLALYPVLNRLQLTALLESEESSELVAARAEITESWHEHERSTSESAETTRSFWDHAERGDLLLTLALLGAVDDGSDTEPLVATLASAYRSAFSSGSTTRERASVIEHLHDLADVAAALGRADGLPWLDGLADRLRDGGQIGTSTARG